MDDSQRYFKDKIQLIPHNLEVITRSRQLELKFLSLYVHCSAKYITSNFLGTTSSSRLWKSLIYEAKTQGTARRCKRVLGEVS